MRCTLCPKVHTKAMWSHISSYFPVRVAWFLEGRKGSGPLDKYFLKNKAPPPPPQPQYSLVFPTIAAGSVPRAVRQHQPLSGWRFPSAPTAQPANGASERSLFWCRERKSKRQRILRHFLCSNHRSAVTSVPLVLDKGLIKQDRWRYQLQFYLLLKEKKNKSPKPFWSPLLRFYINRPF